ncbi:Uncharacterized protein AXF42_Ash003485 [Apostasia shenzhenica]|uniref:Glutaredoxin domain-containing protein n=1 Tax=Apostasia shenzhenica TaxID=1088818 RepID=A0A2I0BGA3_9ASPA|nr:Uncharacterized protein AXF42_Ash003485 [Apostasia shenzhenica]
MGCISSKLLPAADPDPFSGATNPPASGNLPNHIVSLTSSTYGVLNLDPLEEKREATSAVAIVVPKFKKQGFSDPPPEIINWVPAEDLDDIRRRILSPAKRPSRPPPALFTPSPRMLRWKFAGKENNSPIQVTPATDPTRVLKPLFSSEKKQSTVRPKKSGSRRSLSPLFDPELVASFERELQREAEQIKRMVPPTPRNRKANETRKLLRSFEEKCPPGGKNSAVLYTTTLRGIRKTFEECNAVRSVMESYDFRIIERDISMDMRFREELREMMGSREARPPILFVKGRLIGGATEVLRLEEEGELEVLMEGIPRAARSCGGCGGVRFVMCKECNGSCKVRDEVKKKTVRCGGCNENGLVYCPLCCQG